MLPQYVSRTIVGFFALTLLISAVSKVHSGEWQPINLTEEEKERIMEASRKGLIPDATTFAQRVIDTPPWVEDRIGYALKSGVGPGFMRELGAIVETLEDPDIMFKNTQRQFEEHGVIRLFGIILLMPLLLPIDISIALTY